MYKILTHTVFQGILIIILRGRFVTILHLRKQAYGTWEAVQDSAKENKVQNGGGREGGVRETWVQTPAVSLTRCVTLGMFLQISGPSFSSLHVYNNNPQFRVLFI